MNSVHARKPPSPLEMRPLPAVALLLLAACAAPRPETVLFSGSGLEGWRHRNGDPPHWTLVEGGAMEVAPGTGDLVTEAVFGDCRLSLEFMPPVMPEARGQARGNSGVYLQGRYEVQVLDSYGEDPALNGCGAIYGVAPPRVNACKPPGEWQHYEIEFRAPRFDADLKQVEAARVTVHQNGVLIHQDQEVPGVTTAGMGEPYSDFGADPATGLLVARGPLLLQDHGNLVRYRDVRIAER